MAQQLAFRPRTGDIPTQPGVYRFLDANGRVLYVGKAKNLKARLTNYFAPLHSLHERTQRMLAEAADVKWVIVKTEFEALQLEFTWIKEFDPPFNVRFKDDKSYPYLAISLGEATPRVSITRNRSAKGSRYFGPYTNVAALRDTLDAMLKVYPMRSCSSGIYARAKREKRPCLLAHIGKCAAPCVDWVSEAEHKALAKQFSDFFSGADLSQIKGLKERMAKASDGQNYELAAKLRDQISALETVLAKSTVVLTDDTDADLFAVADEELAAALSLFRVRGGRIRGVRGWVIDKELDRSLAEVVEYALQTVYNEPGAEVPKEVLVPELPADREAVLRWLTELRGSKVDLRVPQRGDKAALADTALTNAKHSLALYKTKRVADFTARADALSALQHHLGLESAPLRIECIDVSHLSGTGVVASMVVFEDGLPKKDQYRRFNIEQTTDDTESIYQVVSRRLRHLADDQTDTGEQKFAYRPGLIVVDGGKPQVSAAIRAAKDVGVTDIAICGLAKRLEEIWLPDADFPVILPRASDELFLLQKLRDEAHRFAITAQRQKRSSTLSSVLLEVDGLGEKRAKALLRQFGSVKRIREASVDEIASVSGIGPQLAALIEQQLKIS
jgi:excinuclease ABC subunit C